MHLFRGLLETQSSRFVTVDRSDLISSLFIGKQVLVHNGKSYREVLVTEDMVGYKFGEFCWTRKMNHYDRFKKVKKKLARKSRK